jgi:hypothetical protein
MQLFGRLFKRTPNGTDRCVFERYRVALQFIKKPLGEVRRFEKQRTLCAISSV